MIPDFEMDSASLELAHVPTSEVRGTTRKRGRPKGSVSRDALAKAPPSPMVPMPAVDAMTLFRSWQAARKAGNSVAAQAAVIQLGRLVGHELPRREREPRPALVVPEVEAITLVTRARRKTPASAPLERHKGARA